MKIPYKDTFLTMKHYKEPLLEIPKGKGFGYYGALLGTVDGKGVQCHICGKIFNSLALHVFNTHKIKAKEYRARFQLARTTALISEDFRMRLKERTLEWLKNMPASEKRRFALNKQRWCKEGRAKRGDTQPRETLETKNKKGTCPDQLIYKIREVKEKLGRTPSLHEFMGETGGQRYKHLIFATFGSWLNALRMARLTPVEQKTGGYKHYTNEQLLESLSIFAQEHRKIPTATDCRRGLLCSYEVYQRHFGTFENARELAGVYKFTD